jgi:hypothetical protein
MEEHVQNVMQRYRTKNGYEYNNGDVLTVTKICLNNWNANVKLLIMSEHAF